VATIHKGKGGTLVIGRKLTNTEVVNEVLQARGYEGLNPTQKMALDSGLLSDNRNFVAASPTASGKTVIGELAIIGAVKKGKKGVYLVPLRSLASEKFDDFKKYVGYRISVKTGDYDSDEHDLEACDIIISTYEKWDSILRHQPDWLHTVGCVVADEGHMLTDASRGSTIEVLLTRMVSLKIKVVILSAVLRNVSDVANWLDGRFMESSWRPTPLRKGVYLFTKGKDRKKDNRQGHEIKSLLEYEDGQREKLHDETGDAISNLVVQTLKAGGQCLVFARGRKEAVRLAALLSREVEKELTPRDLLALSEYRYGDDLRSTDVETSNKLAHCVPKGVGFHHAGISSEQKRTVEGLFRDLKLKVVCCTPTLAQGLNLPARRVIIQTITRYDEKLGQVTIPRWEFENMAGRAGRPRYDDHGEAIVISKTEAQMKEILEYIKQPIERLESKLTIEAPFYSNVLSEICISGPCTLSELKSFFSKTFAAHTGGAEFVSGKVGEATRFLQEFELVQDDKTRLGGLVKTALGDRISRLYITPLSVPAMVQGLEASETKPITTIGLLHLICCMYDWQALIVTGRDEGSEYPADDELLVDEEASDRYDLAMRPAVMMQQYIDEVEPDLIYESFDISEGDLHVAVGKADWLIYSLTEVAKLTGHFKILPSLEILNRRVHKGVKEELLSLSSIRGIGAKRARLLWGQGVKTREEFEGLTESQRNEMLKFHINMSPSRGRQTNLNDY
jgi:helicase